MNGLDNKWSRRDFTRFGLSLIPLSTLCSFAEDLPEQRLALFLPGIMGSTLAQQSRSGTVDLWTDSVISNYRTLVKNPNLLRYDGNAATPTGVLECATCFSVPVARYYSGILKTLKANRSYDSASGVCILPYDWRRSILKTLPDVRDRLGTQFKIHYDSAGTALKLPNTTIDIIGHSMGALICLLIVSQQLVHPDNIRSLTLIGPPLYGAASAFRSTFDSVNLPFLEDWVKLFWARSKELAIDTLHGVLASFDSVYELMPPETIPFVSVGSSVQRTHPFTSAKMSATSNARTLPIDKVKSAISTHEAISTGIKRLNLPKNKVHLILGLGLPTDTGYSVAEKASSVPGWHRFILVPPPTSGTGDGTVAYDSSNPLDQLSDRATVYTFPKVRHSRLCDDSSSVEVINKILI